MTKKQLELCKEYFTDPILFESVKNKSFDKIRRSYLNFNNFLINKGY